jgi:hypothetical protein
MPYRNVHKLILTMGILLLCNVSARAQRETEQRKECPQHTSTEPNNVKVIFYNARTDEFLYDTNKRVPPPLPTGEHVILEVCHARFGEQFDFTVTEKTLPEAGAPVRGLDDIAGLIKGLPGLPGAKGTALLESVKFATFPDFASVVARLRSLQDITDLRTELRLDLESIQYGKDNLEEDYKRYRRAICQMTGQIPLVDCYSLGMPLTEATGMPPRVDTLEKRIQKSRMELDTAFSSEPVARGPETSCPSNFNPQGTPEYRDRKQFVCFVIHTNETISQFKSLRAIIQQPPLGSSAADLTSALGEYKLRLFTYRKKLEQVKGAIEIEKVLLAEDADPNVLLSRLKKLQESYKDVITPDDMQKLADQQGHFTSSRERVKLVEKLKELDSRGGELEMKETSAKELVKYANDRIEDVRSVDLAFGARVFQVNRTLVQHVKALYQLYEKSERDPIFVQNFTWSGNTGVILSVKVSDSFKPVDLNKLELPMETMGVEAAGGPAPASPFTPAAPAAANLSAPAPPVPAAPAPAPSGGGGNASTLTTSDFTVTGNTSTAFEVHKTYRFNIAAGVLFSLLREDNYALRTPTTGGSTTSPQLILTGKDRLRLDFPIFLTTYLPKPLDVFTNNSANKRKYGAAVGFSTLDVTNNGYAGMFIQPQLGLDFIFGLHMGRRTVPDRGISLNMPILDPGITTAPVHREWKPGFFMTVGFDALTFKKLFFGAN